MCKLLIATGKLNREQTIRLIESAHESFQSSQKDGFGFVAHGPDGIATGHYLSPSDYVGFGKKLPKFIKRSGNAIESGTIPRLVSALIVHGRTSTNSVVLENVHPFRTCIGSGKRAIDVYLAHNGVLRWTGPGDAPVSSHGCDSEQFLRWLAHDPLNRTDQKRIPESAWTRTCGAWSGYGVLGILEPNAQRLTVAKCGSGHLSWLSGAPDGLHLFSTQCNDVERAGKAIGIRGSGLRVQSKSISTFHLGPKGSRLVRVDSWSGFGESIRDNLWDRSMGIVDPSPRVPRARQPFPDFVPAKRSDGSLFQ